MGLARFLPLVLVELTEEAPSSMAKGASKEPERPPPATQGPQSEMDRHPWWPKGPRRTWKRKAPPASEPPLEAPPAEMGHHPR